MESEIVLWLPHPCTHVYVTHGHTYVTHWKDVVRRG